MKKVSVIMPCYNHGQYLPEALQSVLAQTYANIEVIVVDDGSSDPETHRVLDAIHDEKIKVIKTSNKGVASARNKAIFSSKGDYILPLDADDKIDASYVEKAVAAIESKKNVGIVYCRGVLFGAKSGAWDLPPFSHKQMVRGNMIFCSALYRKDSWYRVNGYDEGMMKGWEDYEFWIALLSKGLGVYQIPEPLFYYRIKPSSRNTDLSVENLLELHRYMFKKHIAYYSEHIDSLFELIYPNSEKAKDRRSGGLLNRIIRGAGKIKL